MPKYIADTKIGEKVICYETATGDEIPYAVWCDTDEHLVAVLKPIPEKLESAAPRFLKKNGKFVENVIRMPNFVKHIVTGEINPSLDDIRRAARKCRRNTERNSKNKT